MALPSSPKRIQRSFGDISVSIVTDDTALRNIIRGMNRVIADLHEPLELFGTHMLNVINERFDGERDEAGHPWARLAPSTQRTRRFLAKREGLPISPAHPILYRTGEMQAGNYFRVTKAKTGRNILTILNKAKDKGKYYATFHHNEDNRFMPKRSFLAFSNTDERTLSKIFEEWLHVIFEREAKKRGIAVSAPFPTQFFRG